MHRSARWPLVLAAVALTVACSSEPAEVGRARSVLAERTAEDSAHYLYAISIMSGSDSPHASAMIVEAIGGSNRAAASEAIRGLGQAADEETLAALHVAFGTSGSVKALAAAVLATREDAEAIEWLAAQLSQGGVLPAPAMVALAETQHSDAVRTAFRGLIWSKNLSTRNEGYGTLGDVGAPWAVELLLEGLDKEFGQERVEPIVGLGRLGDSSAAEPVRQWVNTRGLVLASVEALGRLGDQASVAAIEHLLDHEQPVVRAYAAAAAWRLGARDAAMAAIPALVVDPDAATRLALAEQLLECPGDEPTAWLSQLTQDDAKEVRGEAYRGLIDRKDPAVLARFVEGAQDADYEVATIAMAGLGEAGDTTHSAALGPLLDSDNPYLAISAAHTILVLAGSQP